MEIEAYNEFNALSKKLDGVFTIKDLEIVFAEKSSKSLYRVIEELCRSKELMKIKRGIYARTVADLSAIAGRIVPDSYISTETVLARAAIIGSIPAKRIQAIRIGQPRKYKTPIGIIEYLSISPRLYFGFERDKQANWATPEKAFLDCCYYTYKRKTFSIDLTTDVNFERLNQNLIASYLKQYDRRFVSYYTTIWGSV